MYFQRLHDSFHSDFALLRAAAQSTDPRAPVPSCPEWTVTDLARHVSDVHLHKAECIRLGRFPERSPQSTAPRRPKQP